MPRPLTDTQNDTLSAMLAAGTPQKEIAKAVGCHISHVKRIERNLHYWGMPRRPILRRVGRPHSLVAAHVDVYTLQPIF